MASVIPKWADPELSGHLAAVRSAGEGPTIEFKERFPEQAHRLAQELAALATSGGGVLYIGINDNNDLVGIDAPDGDSRDSIAERAQGIVATVRPNVRAEILFAVEADATVLVVRIPRQNEPVFYYDHRPYIRDGRRSRPATPEEVKACVWAHPSAEFAREKERITLQQIQQIADIGRIPR